MQNYKNYFNVYDIIIFKHYFVKIEKNDWFICQSQNLSVILHPNPIMWRQHIKYGGKNY